jgi:ElaB/YqjD/DUF883 family membrane-anchored ribosome-binding protein
MAPEHQNPANEPLIKQESTEQFNEKMNYAADLQEKLLQIEKSSATPDQKAAAREKLQNLLTKTDQRLSQASQKAYQKIQESFQ